MKLGKLWYAQQEEPGSSSRSAPLLRSSACTTGTKKPEKKRASDWDEGSMTPPSSQTARVRGPQNLRCPR